MSPVTAWQKICAGFFVLLGVGLWIFLSIILSGTQRGRHYHAMFGESVRGLAPGSLVCYNGIEVGKVIAVSNDFTTNKVRVDMVLTDDKAKIASNWKEGSETHPGTVALLVTSFVTGIQYVDLTGGFSNYPDLPENSPIPAGETDFSKLMRKAQGIVGTLEEVVSPQNSKNLQNTFSNLEKFSANLHEEFFGEGKSVLQKVKKILDNLENISGENQQKYIESMLKNLAEMSDLKKTGLQGLIQNVDRESQKLLISFQEMSRDIREAVNSRGQKQDIVSILERVDDLLAENQANLSKTIANLESVSRTLDAQVFSLTKEGNTTLRTVNYFLQKELSRLSYEIQVAIKDLSSVLRILKVKPNALMWGSEVKGEK